MSWLASWSSDRVECEMKRYENEILLWLWIVGSLRHAPRSKITATNKNRTKLRLTSSQTLYYFHLNPGAVDNMYATLVTICREGTHFYGGLCLWSFGTHVLVWHLKLDSTHSPLLTIHSKNLLSHLQDDKIYSPMLLLLLLLRHYGNSSNTNHSLPTTNIHSLPTTNIHSSSYY